MVFNFYKSTIRIFFYSKHSKQQKYISHSCFVILRRSYKTKIFSNRYTSITSNVFEGGKNARVLVKNETADLCYNRCTCIENRNDGSEPKILVPKFDKKYMLIHNM